MRFLGVLFVIGISNFAAAATCADLFAPPIEKVSNPATTTFTQISRPKNNVSPAPSAKSSIAVTATQDFALLWEIPEHAAKLSIDFRKPLLPESIDYLRRATGLASLTEAQIEELYNNNLRLLALRARDKAESLIVDAVLSDTSIEAIIADIAARRPLFAPYVTASLIRGSLESAVHNSNERIFSAQEIAAVVELQALQKMPEGLIDRATEKSFVADAMSRLRPALAHRIQIESEPGCCKTAVCNTCPNSLRLRQEVLTQTGQKLNVHLKKIPGEAPPAQLQLFALQDLLRSRFPEVTW